MTFLISLLMAASMNPATAFKSVHVAEPKRNVHTHPAPVVAYSVNWDAIAQCEGSGDWSLVTTGNGYYFVLQFAPSTWLAYGGTQAELDQGYAPSRERLIQVAENVLAGQGRGAWPNC